MSKDIKVKKNSANSQDEIEPPGSDNPQITIDYKYRRLCKKSNYLSISKKRMKRLKKKDTILQ